MNDITELLSRIKGNIAEIESGGHEEPALDEVRGDFLEMLELIKLFLISERDSYYGYFLINMRFEVNFYANIIAGIKLNTFPPVFESNPLLLCGFTLKEIIYIVCHEIDHVLFNHPAEMVKANPDGEPDTFYEFNLAADAAVNDRISHEIVAEHHNFMAEPKGLITSQALSQMFQLGKIRPLESYAYYFALIHKKRPSIPDDGALQNGHESILSKNQSGDGNRSGGGKGAGQRRRIHDERGEPRADARPLYRLGRAAEPAAGARLAGDFEKICGNNYSKQAKNQNAAQPPAARTV